jgi:uncharacterized protein (DUF1501 family)
MQTRRIFLRNSALAMVGVGAVPGWLTRALYAAQSAPRRKKTLVAIFQRGAADGLNIVVPFGEKRYYELRPTIAVPKPSASSLEDSAIDLDGFFGLHPTLAPLKSLYDAKHLAIVNAAGSPDPSRSHFDAQDYMESGTPGRKATSDGWMNRALVAGPGKPSPVRALALGQSLPRSVRGSHAAIALNSLAEFQVRDTQASVMFETMYVRTADTVLHGAGRDTFEAVKLLKSIQQQPYTPAASANYPTGRFGESLRQIAQLIKADVGVEVAFADIGGWDHHVNEVGARASQGPLATLLRQFGGALAAFWQDLGDRMADVAVVTMSEFGRTPHENGSRGTDHGHGNVMFAMGGGVRGGKIYGEWPGLEKEQLYEGRDLDLTTDFRAVLGELVSTHLGNRDLKTVFPGYAGGPEKFRGLIRA